MKNDLTVIQHKLGRDKDHIDLYGLSDWHVGSKECRTKQIQASIEHILNDPVGYAVVCGDLMDNGLKNSKTNVYDETMSPWEQQEKVYELLKPLAEAGKILCLTDGNHEFRSVREVSISPLYSIACRLRIEDLFRPYMCLLKLEFGEFGARRGNVYGGMVTHGSTRSRHKKFELGAIEGIDFSISGHTHAPEVTDASKIRLNLAKGTAKQVHFVSLVCCAALGAGGYGLQKEYLPSAYDVLQYIRLGQIHNTSANIPQKDITHHTICLPS